MRRVSWGVLTSYRVSPNVMLIIQYALYIIFLKTLHLRCGEGVVSQVHCELFGKMYNALIGDLATAGEQNKAADD